MPQDFTKPLEELTEEEWESLCYPDCAACCRIAGPFACPSLDVETRRCTVYTKRTITETCLNVTPDNISELNAAGVLPDFCGYVRYKNGLPPAPPEPKTPLIPFEEAPEALKMIYIGRRKVWLMEVENAERSNRKSD